MTDEEWFNETVKRFSEADPEKVEALYEEMRLEAEGTRAFLLASVATERLRSSGDLEKALKYADLQLSFSDAPDMQSYHAVALYKKFDILVAMGSDEEAKQWGAKAVEALYGADVETPDILFTLLCKMCDLCFFSNDKENAKKFSDLLRTFVGAIYPEDSPESEEAFFEVGQACLCASDYKGAAKNIKRSLGIHAKAGRPFGYDYIPRYYLLARAYAGLEDPKNMREMCRKALALFPKSEEVDPFMITLHAMEADACLSLSDGEGAIKALDRVLELKRASLPSGDPSLLQELDKLVNIHMNLGDYPKAADSLREGMLIREIAPKEEKDQMLDYYTFAYQLFGAVDDTKHAVIARRHAISAMEATGADPKKVCYEYVSLSTDLMRMDDPEAQSALSKARGIMKLVYGDEADSLLDKSAEGLSEDVREKFVSALKKVRGE